jgi:hypothetical protein
MLIFANQRYGISSPPKHQRPGKIPSFSIARTLQRGTRLYPPAISIGLRPIDFGEMSNLHRIFLQLQFKLKNRKEKN